MLCSSFPSAQQLLDRVLARVDTNPITLTDVQAALALGIVQVDSGDPVAEGTQRMIDRQLELTEVQRFPPPEPSPAGMSSMNFQSLRRLPYSVRLQGSDDRAAASYL